MMQPFMAGNLGAELEILPWFVADEVHVVSRLS